VPKLPIVAFTGSSPTKNGGRKPSRCGGAPSSTVVARRTTQNGGELGYRPLKGDVLERASRVAKIKQTDQGPSRKRLASGAASAKPLDPAW